jgi:hypothetical protein
MVSVADIIVADAGGRSRLLRVDGVDDDKTLHVTTRDVLLWRDVTWWHLPMTHESDVAVMSKDRFDRLEIASELSIRGTNFFGESSIAEFYARLAQKTEIHTVTDENIMCITLRPVCERVRILPNVSMGLGRLGMISCATDETDAVCVHGYVCTANEFQHSIFFP